MCAVEAALVHGQLRAVLCGGQKNMNERKIRLALIERREGGWESQ